MPQHPPAAESSAQAAARNVAVSPDGYQLRVHRCCVDFELKKQLLFRTHQPTLTARFLRRGIDGAVLIKHRVESGYFDQTFTAAMRSAVALGLNRA